QIQPYESSALNPRRSFSVAAWPGRGGSMAIKDTDKAHSDPKADLRRRALAECKTRLGVSFNQWAARAGLANANGIYNFLNGASKSLSHETYEKLVGAFPAQVTIEELKAESAPVNRSKVVPVIVRGTVAFDSWRHSFDMPLSEQFEIDVPRTITKDRPHPF